MRRCCFVGGGRRKRTAQEFRAGGRPPAAQRADQGCLPQLRRRAARPAAAARLRCLRHTLVAVALSFREAATEHEAMLMAQPAPLGRSPPARARASGEQRRTEARGRRAPNFGMRGARLASALSGRAAPRAREVWQAWRCCRRSASTASQAAAKQDVHLKMWSALR
ncbi:hypothetical protein FA09DRAFT_24032 [Tilletiopsis washingtonensis]|uniref:Uncharacterized protein n=1 Tax=Tilletiopsis washingtonensis TaxID=58919 RepID=A0A316ZB89_9BASI|nr:hypothetical protein FA09DRAFT_24032 [Tilletiopsis washingtonensis]PWN98288.1 hypothetical protein FA09DRAFT_24032 [Tilletiopsis washingtonensis]